MIAIQRASRRVCSLETGLKQYWEIIAGSLSNVGWSLGCVSAVDSEGRTVWIADAHRSDGQRFIVHADEKLTAFVELKSAIRGVAANWLDKQARIFPNSASLRGSESRRRTFSPPGFFASSRPAICRINTAGKRKEEPHESTYSDQNVEYNSTASL
jgi:hypothetical protein